MRTRFSILLTFFLCFSVSACGNNPESNPDPGPGASHTGGLSITFPAHGSEIFVAQDPSDQYFYWHWTPGYITMVVNELPRTNDTACPYAPLVFNLSDNGGPFRGAANTPLKNTCSTEAPNPEVSYSWDPDTLGVHTLTAELVIDIGNGNQRTISSDSITVCVLNDPSRPVKSIPVGSVSADCKPTAWVEPTP